MSSAVNFSEIVMFSSFSACVATHGTTQTAG